MFNWSKISIESLKVLHPLFHLCGFLLQLFNNGYVFDSPGNVGKLPFVPRKNAILDILPKTYDTAVDERSVLLCICDNDKIDFEDKAMSRNDFALAGVYACMKKADSEIRKHQ